MIHHGSSQLWPSEIRTFFTGIKNLFLALYSKLIKVRVRGRDFFAKPQANSIVVANHVTGADSFVLQIALRRRLFMLAARRWFRSRFLEFVMIFFCDMIPVACERGFANICGIRRALALLGHRQSLGVYPAGEMYRDSSIPSVHDGAAFLALKSGVPILPVFVKNLALGPERLRLDDLGDDANEGVGSLVRNLFNRKIEVFIGEPIYPRIVERDKKRELNRLNTEIKRSLEELRRHASLN